MIEVIKLQDCDLSFKEISKNKRPNSKNRFWFQNKIIFNIVGGNHSSLQYDSSDESSYNANFDRNALDQFLESLKNDFINLTLEEFSFKLLRYLKKESKHKVYMIYRWWICHKNNKIILQILNFSI